MIKVEYLLPFKTDEGICCNKETFIALLSTNSNFEIGDNFLTYKKQKYKYELNIFNIKKKNSTVFNIIFKHTKLTNEYKELLKAFRKTVGNHMEDNIQVIWDGISFEWSKELYPKIYTVENLMRMLISKFMLTKIGVGWHEKTIPKVVKESIKSSERKKEKHNILYEVDFIQLLYFLFNEYTDKEISKLPDYLSKKIKEGKVKEITEQTIEGYIPQNNWDRYFSEKVEMKSDELRRKWEKLYDIRCKIAHNKSLDLDEYNNGNKICSDITEVLEESISNIAKINISEKNKETISMQTIGILNKSKVKITDHITFAEATLNLSPFKENKASVYAGDYGVRDMIKVPNLETHNLIKQANSFVLDEYFKNCPDIFKTGKNE